MSDVVVIEREPVEVMVKRVPDDQEGITKGWAELDAAVGSLRGRHFYGVFDGSGEYRCCVETRGGDDAAALGFELGTLPGGRYARLRLEGEPPAIYREIAPSFERLSERPDRDPDRPGLEYYRRHDVVDLLLPVR